MNIKQPRRWIFPLICYGIVLVLWLLFAGIRFGIDSFRISQGILQRKELRIAELRLEGVKLKKAEDGLQKFVSTDTDPHLVYAPSEEFYANRLTIKATPHKPPGEMVLYYTDVPQEANETVGFSDKNRIWAKQGKDGSWHFDLDKGNYTALRLDPDTAGGVIWKVEKLVLNEAKPIIEYFLPDARIIFVLLILPIFLSELIRETLSACKMYILRRSTKRISGKK